MEEKTRTFRKGGTKEIRKKGSARVIVTSVYIGDKPMADAICNAVIDSYKRRIENRNEGV